MNDILCFYLRNFSISISTGWFEFIKTYQILKQALEVMNILYKSVKNNLTILMENYHIIINGGIFLTK